MTNETLTLSQLAALTSQREAGLRVLAASVYLQRLMESAETTEAH